MPRPHQDLNNVRYYHSHIYYEESTRSSATALQKAIAEAFQGHVRVHGLIDQPIGPHPLPMFEVDFTAAIKTQYINWLEQNHNGHSVLIHPLSGDELADHQDYPEWVGPALILNLEFLKH